jgi:hypothetical protein
MLYFNRHNSATVSIADADQHIVYIVHKDKQARRLGNSVNITGLGSYHAGKSKTKNTAI